MLFSGNAWSHGVADTDREFIMSISGSQFIPYVYLGAKHMFTGYDHLLFIFGVIFLLRHYRDVAVLVSLFALGHSITLLAGVLFSIPANAYLVDAIIGLSVVYKGFDNIQGFDQLFGVSPNPKFMVLGFGLIHGLGLSTKLQDFELPAQGLLGNLIAFNVGVEIGQFLALICMLIVMAYWRAQPNHLKQAYSVNVVLMTLGFMLTFFQLAGFILL